MAQAGTHRVLSQARGDFLITVTLTSLADGGSEALVSIADARAAFERRECGFEAIAVGVVVARIQIAVRVTAVRVALESGGQVDRIDHRAC